MAGITLQKALDAFDRLDGSKNGKYFRIPMQQLEFVRDARKECRTNTEDCKTIVRNLNALVGIAKRLPVLRFAADKKKKMGDDGAQLLKGTTAEEMFVTLSVISLIVHMSVSLVDLRNPQDIFVMMPSHKVSEMVREIGDRLAGRDIHVNWGNLVVNGAAEAYQIFERVGKHRGFDPSFLKPARSKARREFNPFAAPTAPRHVPAPTAAAAEPTQKPVGKGTLDFDAYKEDPPAPQQQQPTPSPQVPSKKEGDETRLNFDKY